MRLLLSTLIAGALFASSARADAINTRPLDPLGDNGFENTLQEIFDSITVSGPGIDAVDDQISAALFTNTASGGAVATFMIELTGGASSQSFGIYDGSDSTKKVQIFGGSDSSGDQALISFMANGDIKVNLATKGNFGGGSFGFYLESADGTMYSEDSLNSGGDAQALIYQGKNDTIIQIPDFLPGVFTDDEFIIAFEDSVFANSDKDFNDFVALVESIQPVPEPGSFALLGLAIAGFAVYRRRRR